MDEKRVIKVFPNAAMTTQIDYSGCFVAGCRVFNVAVQGSTFLTNFDVYAAAGGGNVGIVRSTTTTVTDGALTIAFQAPVSQYPTINAIEVVKH